MRCLNPYQRRWVFETHNLELHITGREHNSLLHGEIIGGCLTQKAANRRFSNPRLHAGIQIYNAP